jgi:D-alanine-D-alanine ligase
MGIHTMTPKKPRSSKGRGLTIGLVYDLRDDYLAEGFTQEQVAEFDSAATLNALDETLRSLGYQTERIGHGVALSKRLARGDRWDLVFNISEGLYGRSREAQVPALLEMYQVPYTFSDPLVCAVTLDKAVAKRLVRDAGLRTPAFAVVSAASDLKTVDLSFPLFAKPIAEGTGKGVDSNSRIDGPEQLAAVCRRLLRRFGQPVLVEEYLPGREFTTAILGTGDKARVLGTMEFTISRDAPAKDYSFEVKELCEQYVHYFPMSKGRLRGQVELLALQAYRVLECRDTARVDVRLDGRGRPAFMEVNPLPGLHPHHSDLPMIATQKGMTYAALIGRIVDSALRRGEVR